jgi:hypothetical protein
MNERQSKRMEKLMAAFGVQAPRASQIASIDTKGVMGNWLAAHAYLSSLPVDAASIERAAHMLWHELQRDQELGGPRDHMLTRIYGKLLFIRRDVERGLLDDAHEVMLRNTKLKKAA